ncbi:unnamed protein product [Jaminaea pallidilutea]
MSSTLRPPPSTAAATSDALAKIIGDNARERRVRYKALRDSGRGSLAALWQGNDQAATASQSGQSGLGQSEERTAHLLLRVLALCFVVPLINIEDDGIPENVGKHDISFKDALDTMQQMIQEQPGTLDDVFASSPVPDVNPSPFVSTTLDVWLCPRLFLAAVVISVRGYGLLPASNSTESEATKVAQTSALELRETLIDRVLTVLRYSITKTNHLESVRTTLQEILHTGRQCLSRFCHDPSAEGNGNPSDTSLLFALFHEGTRDGQCLTLARHQASGDGIARLWLPEDHSTLILGLPDPPPSRRTLIALAQSCAMSAASIVLGIAAEFPAYLADLGQAASKLLLDISIHEMDAQIAELDGTTGDAQLQQLRYGIFEEALQRCRRFDLWPLTRLSQLATRSVGRFLSADRDNVALGCFVLRLLRFVRRNTSNADSMDYNELRPIADLLIEDSVSTAPSIDSQGTSSDKTGFRPHDLVHPSLARKFCALEVIHGMMRSEAQQWILTPSQQLTLIDDIGSWLESDTKFSEFAGDLLGSEYIDEMANEMADALSEVLCSDHPRSQKLQRKRQRSKEGQVLVVKEVENAWDGNCHPNKVTCQEIFDTARQVCASAGTLRRDEAGKLFCILCDKKFRPGEAVPSGEEPSISSMLDWLAAIFFDIDSTRQPAVFEYFVRDMTHKSPPAFKRILWTIVKIVELSFRHRQRSIRLGAARVAYALAARHCQLVEAEGGFEQHHLIVRILAFHTRLLQSDRATPKEKETIIISLGHLGQLKSEHLQREVLLALVLELRGSILLQSCAYLQITQLAAFHRCSTYALLAPHFGVIAPAVVERMTSAPTLFLEVLHLTGQSQAKFLQATLPYTLPRVIANRNAKALSLIVSALNTSVGQLCLEQAPAILKEYLLMPPGQRDENIETYLETMRRASNQDVPLRGLYRSYIGEILGHLVATLGDPDRREAAVDGLRHIEATLSDHSTASATKAKAMGRTGGGGDLSAFLKDEILGILSWLNDDLMSVNGKKSPSFKAMVTRSIGVFVEIVGSAIGLVAPQIMATLSGTLQVPELRLASLLSWKTFMSTLRFDDVGPFIGQTAAALLSEWPALRPIERSVAKKILHYLVVENAQEMRKYIVEIPNLDDLASEMPEVCRKVRSSRQAWSAEQQLDQILDRAADENANICLRSLHELLEFLSQNRNWVEQQASGSAFGPAIGRMITVLLNTARRSSDSQRNLQELCLQCIGTLGAVDPDRLEMSTDDSPHKLLQNFEDREETIDFAVHLVRDILVSAFRATSDTKHQASLAYAIQELLAFCGFTSVLLRSSARNAPVKVKQRWNDLPASVVDTISPLLDSKYSITHGPPTEYPKPFYTHSASYRDWIEMWANHLMQSASGDDAQRIFGVFRVLIRHHDLDVTQHILPHAVLHNLISGTDAQREDLRQEFVSVLLDQVDPTTNFAPDRRLLCAQTVFGLMDHMSAWLRLKRQERLQKPGKRREAGAEEALANVDSVIASISQELMARASLECRAYARSLLNFESRIRSLRGAGKTDHDLQSYYEQLHMIYADIDEPDGMEGMSTRIISPSLEHQIREHETTGRWTSAQSCWEVQIQASPGEASNHVGLLRCLRNLGHYDTMRTHVRGALSVNPQWEGILAPFAIEGACILEDWGEAEQALSRSSESSPQEAMARVLLAMTERSTENPGDFRDAHKQALRQLGKPILAAGRNSYSQMYDSIVQLHTLHELELIQQATTDGSPASMQRLQRSLRARLDATQPSFRVREPLLSVRRSAFSANEGYGCRSEVADAWISTCKIARKAGHSQTAYSAVLQAGVAGAPFAFVQRSKLLAANDQPHAAIQELTNSLHLMHGAYAASAAAAPGGKDGVIDLTSDAASPEAFDRRTFANANLLRARYCEGTGRYQSNEIIERYKTACRIDPNSEKMYYYLGHYYDTSRESNVANSMSQNYQVCHNYLKAAQLGTKFFYRTLPRLLTIWLDTGDDAALIKIASRGGCKKYLKREDNVELYDRAETFERIVAEVRKARDGLQAYQWFACFPQLTSRMVHKNDAVWQVLKGILSVVVKKYPEQAMWGLVAAFQSTDSSRRRRATEIVQASKDNRNSKTIETSQHLASELLHLCNFPVSSKTTALTLERDFPRLHALADCRLIVPIQASLTVSLPTNNEPKADHSPFPLNVPRFKGFESTIEIMQSLQKPRKVVVIAGDGKRYPFLCKPKDDLRKDARLMEFDSMINGLLQTNSESRKRRLLCRTYGVTTLNEDCGLIEWVPNTIGLRHVLNKLYQSKGIPIYSNEIRLAMDEARLSARSSGKIFEEKVLRRFPSVFHEWFLNTFPEPATWLRARQAYARSAAVMSMVGSVLGLGDRHGENILFDSVSGDTVHVDLNCLFEKGATFEIPETVPFRLTHNMVDAMGVAGYEGAFRRAAEITMAILRANKDSLTSVLETMIHDPLVEWGAGDVGGHSSRKASASTAGRPDPRMAAARHALDPVAKKLEGCHRKPDMSWSQPLSTNNLVDALIREATDSKNLAKLYCGWMSWL